MTDLEKYQAVNECETADELANVLLMFSTPEGRIQGRTRTFDTATMTKGLFMFMNGDMPPNVLTREFGIRQQAMYIKHYSI